MITYRIFTLKPTKQINDENFNVFNFLICKYFNQEKNFLN